MYLQKDPIGLAGNNPNEYAYVHDTNKQVDILGLTVGEFPVFPHVALGYRSCGLRTFAGNIGADHLLNVDESIWKEVFLSHVGNPDTKFSVNLEGSWGADVETRISNMIGEGSYTGWEMKQLQESGRLGDVDFYLGGEKVNNPFKYK